MAASSAGVLVFRLGEDGLEVFLVHPGGPFWVGRDEGAWSIPKGLIDPGEDLLTAALREFEEETGFAAEETGFAAGDAGPAPAGRFLDLGALRQPGGKVVHVWAVEGDLDPAHLRSNTFEMEWPPRSGRRREFPEVDRGAWFPPSEVERRLHRGQRGFVARLVEALGPGRLGPPGGGRHPTA